MIIGVVSDTHMYNSSKILPKALTVGLQGVELIIHAGDWVGSNVVSLFEQIAPVESVAGNNDGDEIVNRFGRKKLLTLAGYRIGLTHGDGYFKTSEARAIEAFTEEVVHIIIFGHSHIPYMGYHLGVLLFNPGSPTDKRRQPNYSYGIIELGETVKANHYYYNDKK